MDGDFNLVTLIGNMGFPIAVAVYLLIRLESTLKENTKVQQSMLSMLQLIMSKLETKGE